jgi:thiamine transport system ATP-binding protein
MLRVENLTFLFPDFTGRYNFTLPSVHFAGLVGPSGGGKTTLLDGMAGFLVPASGQMSLDGYDFLPLSPSLRPITMLFQDHNLFPHLSALENIGLGIRPSLHLTEDERTLAMAALHDVEMAGFENRSAAQLSGGEKQRIALARALVSGRRILLLDEAFGGLDPGLRKAMLALMRDLQKKHGLTVIASIHTPHDLLPVADSMIFVAGGEVVFHGGPEAFFTPETNPQISRYLG